MESLPMQGKSDLRIIWPFVPILIALVLLGAFCVDVLTDIRAFVNGESRWSKREKTAVIHLLRYADSREEGEFQAFQQEIEVLEGDRLARLEIQKKHPDREYAIGLLVKGGLDRQDSDGIIRVFRIFGGVPSVAHAIQIWEMTDAEIADLREDAQELRQAVKTGADVTPVVRKIEAADVILTTQESDFSQFLGDLSRELRDWMIPGIGIAAALLLLPGILMVLRNIRREREHTQRLAHQVSHDALTGLYNRSAFERRLEQAIAQLGNDECVHSLMYLDLDQFKVVNDTCGHAAGDDLIREIAGLMRAQLRKRDTLARLGGDEFGVLLECCDVHDGERLAEAIREAVASYRFVRGQRSFTLAVSIGLIRLDRSLSEVTDALSAADAACYMAKQKGRNRVQIYEQSDEAVRVFHQEMEWVSRVHAALADGRFCLHAQEIAPLQKEYTGGRHIELLLRMVDEDGTLVPPMDFIPACERYNLMASVDRWVVNAGFAEMARKNAESPGEIALCALNLSAASLSDDSMPDYIEERARVYNTPLHQFCLEITETAAVQNIVQARMFIDRLRAIGCRFALDDFGVGMASFAYLKHLPAEYIKIDGFFIREMLDMPLNLAVIEAIQRIGLTTGHRIIAEHVDTSEKLERLRELGVDFAQGFGVAAPEYFAGNCDPASAYSGADEPTADESLVRR